MRAGTVALIAALAALLGAAGWYAYQGLIVPGEPMPRDSYIALTIGVVLSIIVGAGLMTLLFFSSRRGYDEPPTFKKED
ncbi:hypothetical protein [Tardiphaga robiniae]|uniref:Uncharacterized protein n=1 Tax=Tardiphaga robiniae TaxID=943830 RepID=A0A161QZG1_9BRAD|nr:hypothetical protein [Tardiphaga robiniae]KZD21591.1 hypothetical protein A4A58_13145 [Tardiphaga robiniae]